MGGTKLVATLMNRNVRDRWNLVVLSFTEMVQSGDKDADKKTMPIVGDVYTISIGLLEERETERREGNFSILSHMMNDLSGSYCLMQQTEARKYRWLCPIL